MSKLGGSGGGWPEFSPGVVVDGVNWVFGLASSTACKLFAMLASSDIKVGTIGGPGGPGWGIPGRFG